jgi:hypothetical protein
LVQSTPGAGQTSPQPGRPRTGREIGRGAEGVVYENLDQPDWVVKEFHMGGTSPFQDRNEFENLEKARAIPGRADNVVRAMAPADPRQGFLVKEKVLPTDVPEDLADKASILQDFLPHIPDAGSNMLWGTTMTNPTPRWILIE